MKHRLKKNTRAEESFVRDLERAGASQKVERGEAHILAPSQYPEPIKRFLQRERGTLRVRLSPSAKKKLDSLSQSKGVDAAQLARRWVEQGLAREAG